MPFATINGADLFYTDEGTGQPILLVHGYTCDGQDWAYQIPALRQNYRVITVDLRGHGRSSAPEAPETYNPRSFANDLAELIERLSASPVVAIGHSMGGATVVALAVEHPHLVRALVPVDSAYGWDPASRDGLNSLAASFGGPMAHHVVLQFFNNNFYPPASPPHLAAAHGRRVMATPLHVLRDAFNGLLHAPAGFGFRPAADAYLQRVAAPALIFRAGSQDPAAVAQWERAQFSHGYSRAIGWEGTGHFLHQERPAEFNAILLEWLAGLPAGS
jgi:pimeloyl-ACP methyl ester carboxylesterase